VPHLQHRLIKTFWRSEARGLWEPFDAARVCEVNGGVIRTLVDQTDFLIVKPLRSLTVLPDSVLHAALLAVVVRSDPVLLASVPPALVPAAICPLVDTVALFLVICELALIPNAVSVNVDSTSMHVVLRPLTIELAAVSPQVAAEPVDLVVKPLSFIS